MSVSSKALKQLTISDHVQQQTVVGALPRSIHRDPGLRDWVTLESIAITPIPVLHNDGWHLVSLLTVPARSESGELAWLAPWGAVQWSWPQGDVVQTIDLRDRSDFSELRRQSLLSAQPVDLTIENNVRSRTLQENALFSELDKLLATTEAPASLSELTQHYASLLPAELYAYYHILVPESQQWLHPNISKLSEQSSLQQVMPSLESSIESQTVLEPIDSPAINIISTALDDQLQVWLNQSLAIAQQFSLTQMQSCLQQLKERQQLPGFRLAFVGEFSRGKSSLINRLLESDVLPVGALPTKASLISMVAGSEDRAELGESFGSIKAHSLDEISWEEVLASIQETGDYLMPMRITLDHPWLHSLDIELIDTPGAGDLKSQPAAIVSDLLSQCDAVVLVISGTLPLSLAERSFLEQKVMGQHVPQVLVAVSKLDTVEPPERSDIMQMVRQRLDQISPAITLLPTHPLEGETTDEGVLDNIRFHIEAVAQQGDRRYWRNYQVANQLAGRVSQMAAFSAEALAAEQMDAETNRKALQAAQEKLNAAELDWEQISLDLNQRRLQLEQTVRQRVQANRQDLVDRVAYDLSRSSAPKTWWERDFPFQLRREFMLISRKLEQEMMETMHQDFAWLTKTLTSSFNAHLPTTQNPLLDQLSLQPRFKALKLANTVQYRVFARLGVSAATLAGYLFGGPVAILASTAVWVAGERVIAGEVKAQRQVLDQEMLRCIDRAIDSYCREVSDRLRRVYSQFAEDVQQQRVDWHATRTQALQANFQSQSTQDWQALLDQANALQQEIIAALETSHL